MALAHGHLALFKPADVRTKSGAEVADLPLMLQSFQGLEDFIAVQSFGFRVVQLVEVDMVGVQTPQALFASEFYKFLFEFLGTLLVADAGHRFVIEIVAEFGSDDYFVAAVTHEFGQHLFSVAFAIGVSGIEEVNTQLQGILEQRGLFGFGALTPPIGGHSPNAEAHFGEFQVGAGQLPVFHKKSFLPNR